MKHGKTLFYVFCNIGVCPSTGNVQFQAYEDLKSSNKTEMDNVAAHGNAVVSCTEYGDLSGIGSLGGTLEFMCHGGV